MTVIKHPYSDVGSDAFFELHQGETITGTDTVMFDRAYEDTPLVLISSYAAEPKNIDIPATNDRVVVEVDTDPTDVDILVIGNVGDGTIKHPISDVTTRSFFEIYRSFAATSGGETCNFERTYDESPCVITTPRSQHTHHVTSLGTSSADIHVGSSGNVDVLVMSGPEDDITKKPFSDVTSDVFFERHIVTLDSGDPRQATLEFERSYDSEPAVFVTPSTQHSIGVTARTTEQCTLTSSAAVTTIVQVLVIGR